MTHGLINTDWANPVNYERMRNERLEKARTIMAEQKMDALICFAPDNIRYLTGVLGLPIPKPMRYCIITLNNDPILYEQGGDIGRVQENTPWLQNVRVAVPIYFVSQQETLSWAHELKNCLGELGVKDGKIGFDQISFKVLRVLNEVGIDAQDCVGILAEARSVKTPDEIELIRASVSLAELAFNEARKVIAPGARECDIQAAMAKVLIERGVEMLRGVCTARSYPYWRTFTSERQVSPGDIVIIDRVHIYRGYACDHVRSFVCGKASGRQKELFEKCNARLQATLDQIKPGNTTADVQAKLGDPDGYSETTIHWGHGIGLDTHEWPYVSCSSTKDPVPLKRNMTMAVETYIHDGSQGVRLEENILVTTDGYEVLSAYPLGEDFE